MPPAPPKAHGKWLTVVKVTTCIAKQKPKSRRNATVMTMCF